MDLKTISDQILSNIDNFEPEEKKVIILKLLDFLKQKEEENQGLSQENTDLVEENETLKNQQVDEDEYKTKIDEIIDLANNEAKNIVDAAHVQVEGKINDIESQGKDYIYELLSRIEKLVENMHQLDEEAKLYRLHILTIFKKTIFRFSESDYHILKIDDADLKQLLQFYKTDDELQEFSNQIMSKLSHFEKYLQLNLTKVKEEDLESLEMNHLEKILEENFNVESDVNDVINTENEEILSNGMTKNETADLVNEEKRVDEPASHTDDDLEVNDESFLDEETRIDNEKKEQSPQFISTNDSTEQTNETNEKFIDIFNKYYR